MKKIIGQGAEATVYREWNKVVKQRHPKKYRHPKIDDTLRKFRTRREAKVMEKLASIDFPGPKLNSMCDKQMLIKTLNV